MSLRRLLLAALLLLLAPREPRCLSARHRRAPERSLLFAAASRRGPLGHFKGRLVVTDADQKAKWYNQARPVVETGTFRNFNTSGCDRCAVVGASSSLLYGQPQGHIIDGHDCILRANDAPTGPKHAYRVGSRTDFQFVHLRLKTSTASALEMPYEKLRVSAGISDFRIGEGSRQKTSATRNVILNVLPKLPFGKGSDPILDIVARLLQNEEYKHVVMQHVDLYIAMEEWAVSKPVRRRLSALSHNLTLSMGTPKLKAPFQGELMIGFASRVCKQVNIFGFNVTSVPYHYYTPSDVMEWTQDEAVVHLWQQEALQNGCMMLDNSRKHHPWDSSQALLIELDQLPNFSVIAPTDGTFDTNFEYVREYEAQFSGAGGQCEGQAQLLQQDPYRHHHSVRRQARSRTTAQRGRRGRVRYVMKSRDVRQ
mmetsp:Transcript_4033/g.14375  ORF Transcript_4033/g.14375 Transcript_4033/m.14375 type:complete len:424 (+) Transcript_4033:123-1394(+)